MLTPALRATLREPGRPLDSSVRASMEGALGADFGAVRVHADAGAAAAASAVYARAAAVGEHVLMNRGEYAPGTPRGRGLLAHELGHVIEQRHGPREVARARIPLGSVTIQVDYGNVASTPVADQKSATKALIATFTGDSAPYDATVDGLSDQAALWALWAMDLLVDNTRPEHARLDRARAVTDLLSHAAAPVSRPGGAGPEFELEVMQVSGWSEAALTTGLGPPTGTTATEVHELFSPPPTTGSVSDPLDVAAFRSRMPGLVEALLNRVDPASWGSTGTRDLPTLQGLGDRMVEEARDFFSPWADSARGNVFTTSWHASASIFATETMTPDRGLRLSYLRNRAQIVGWDDSGGTAPFDELHFDGSRDDAELQRLAEDLEAKPAVAAQVDRLIQHTGRQSGSGAATTIGIVTEYDASRQDELEARWSAIDTLTHEVLHAMVHPDFRAAAGSITLGQVVREGFTEVLGVELYNERVKPKAAADATFKAAMEVGLTPDPAFVPPDATVGYGQAGRNARDIETRVGRDNFRAAYFLGRRDLVGL